MMFGGIGILSAIVLIQTCFDSYGRLGEGASGFPSTTTRIRTASNSIEHEDYSWMDRIIMHRTVLADVSHLLKRTAHDRKGNKKKNRNGSSRERRTKNSVGSSSGNPNDLMVDISNLYKAVGETVRDIGVRGLLFEVLSDDFEYYVYSDESNDESDDDDYSEIDAYWSQCYRMHGVGKHCNEWDVWWTYHYIGAILTDMLLDDGELLWDGSSGERIVVATTHDEEGRDNAMAELLDKIHYLQAYLPYVNQSSFHAQHALIWRYVQRFSDERSKTYPWDLAVKFCRGDGSRPKGIVGRPVDKGVDHECFHGFGHAMFYLAAKRQLERERKSNENDFLFLRPHGGFELAPESYCEIHELCKGASPPKKKRRAIDPNDEASSNSYRICFEGVVHSVRLLSEDSPTMTDKDAAIAVVGKEMKRCSRERHRKEKQKNLVPG